MRVCFFFFLELVTNAVNKYIYLASSFLCSFLLATYNFLAFGCLFYLPSPFLNCSVILPCEDKFSSFLPFTKKICGIRGCSFFSTYISTLQCFNFTLHEQTQSYSQIKARKDISLLDFPSETRTTE